MEAGDVVRFDAEKLDPRVAVEALICIDQTERLVLATGGIQNMRDAELLENRSAERSGPKGVRE